MEGKGGADGEENDDEEGYFEATVAEPQEGGASKSSMDLNLVDKFQKIYNSVSIKVIRARATHLQGDRVEGRGRGGGEENDVDVKDEGRAEEGDEEGHEEGDEEGDEEDSFLYG